MHYILWIYEWVVVFCHATFSYRKPFWWRTHCEIVCYESLWWLRRCRARSGDCWNTLTDNRNVGVAVAVRIADDPLTTWFSLLLKLLNTFSWYSQSLPTFSKALMLRIEFTWHFVRSVLAINWYRESVELKYIAGMTDYAYIWTLTVSR